MRKNWEDRDDRIWIYFPICIGLGTGLGALLGNVGVGIAIGAAVGTTINLLMNYRYKNG
jgi:hypothetical protein